MTLRIRRDYNEYKKGQQVRVSVETARRLIKLGVGVQDKMITGNDYGVHIK